MKNNFKILSYDTTKMTDYNWFEWEEESPSSLKKT